MCVHRQLFLKCINLMHLSCFQVIDGGDMDVNFVVQSPKGEMLLTDIRKSAGVHRYDILLL